jgi:transcription elongation factor Elf1
LLSDLSAPVDVYYDWVDACDAVAKESGQDSRSQAPLVSPRINRKDSEAAARADKYDEQDGFVVADEADAGDGDFPDDA